MLGTTAPAACMLVKPVNEILSWLFGESIWDSICCWFAVGGEKYKGPRSGVVRGRIAEPNKPGFAANKRSPGVVLGERGRGFLDAEVATFCFFLGKPRGLDLCVDGCVGIF